MWIFNENPSQINKIFILEPVHSSRSKFKTYRFALRVYENIDSFMV